VLAREERPALYLHEQAFALDGRRLVRRGLLARVRLAHWEEGVILPHERTFPGPVAERLARLRAVGANLSPIYLLAPDPDGALRALLAEAAAHPPDVEGTDPAGDGHRLTVLPDPRLAARARALFAPRRLYVADGHHRFEAALAYRDERRAAAGGAWNPDAPEAFVLALIAPIGDEGVRVLPTHRLVRGVPGFDPARVRAALGAWFELRRDPDAALAPDGGDPAEVCRLRFADDPAWYRLRAKAGAPHAALLPAGRSAAWRGLDVAILGSVVLERLLGLEPARWPAHLGYTADAAAAEAAVAAGGAQVAALLPPPRLADLVAVADEGETLPPKSTYFHPKAPAGLVVNELG
jgi:uncharacterized protein (DUF1015 family)